MAIYVFSFDDKYAGHTAVVTDHTGTEVTGSPITLNSDGDGTLALSNGTYRAQVDNSEGWFGDGYSVVDGVFDVGLSIAAAGVDIDLPGGSYAFEINNGATLVPDTGGFVPTPFDTLDGNPLTDQVLTPGLYLGKLEIDFVQPAEDRLVSVRISAGGGAGAAIKQGPFTVSSSSTYSDGYIVWASGAFIITAGHNLSFLIATSSGGAVSPADLVVDYATFAATRIA